MWISNDMGARTNDKNEVKAIKAELKRIIKDSSNYIFGKPFSNIYLTCEALAQRYTVISFDIFDTLIYRMVDKPSDVFEIIQEKSDLKDFKRNRINAEVLARKEKSKNGMDEVSLDEIYEMYEKTYAFDFTTSHKELSMVKELEIATELEITYPNFNALKVYNRIISLRDAKYGKLERVIIVSDMYLPESGIAKILEKAGFNGYDNLFLSCDYNATKKCGNLFGIVLDEIDKSADSVLHIGDNVFSDYIKAKKYGLKSILCKKDKSEKVWRS